MLRINEVDKDALLGKYGFSLYRYAAHPHIYHDYSYGEYYAANVGMGGFFIDLDGTVELDPGEINPDIENDDITDALVIMAKLREGGLLGKTPDPAPLTHEDAIMEGNESTDLKMTVRGCLPSDGSYISTKSDVDYSKYGFERLATTVPGHEFWVKQEEDEAGCLEISGAKENLKLRMRCGDTATCFGDLDAGSRWPTSNQYIRFLETAYDMLEDGVAELRV